MELSGEIRQQLIPTFKVEQLEHVQTMTEGLLALEGRPGPAEQKSILASIFRAAHSMKGAAQAVNVPTVARLGHALEDLLLHAKEGRLSFSAELFDLLHEALDTVELVLEKAEVDDGETTPEVMELLKQLGEVNAIANQESAPLPPAEPALTQPTLPKTAVESPTNSLPTLTNPTLPGETAANAEPEENKRPELTPSQTGDQTIRVSVNKLDALMAQSSELLAAKIRAEQRLVEVRELELSTTEWQKKWHALRPHQNRLLRNQKKGNGRTPQKQLELTHDLTTLVDFFYQNQDLPRQFNTKINTLYRQFANDIMRLSLNINELQEEIKRMRMLPLSTITKTFGRIVRDIAREQNKQVNLVILGEETELDKRVLEQIKDPLIHMLRNAADHGIESPEKRVEAGKPATGEIVLEARQQGTNVVITIADDGTGLDLDKLRYAAVRKGMLTQAEAAQLDDAEAKMLVFTSGLSTSQIITNISGRGVGMDIVRKNVEDLQGMLEVCFEPGQGTTYSMTLPLTLASSHGLLVQAGGQLFALPLTNIERMVQVERREINTLIGKSAIVDNGKPLAVAWLEDVLQLPSTTVEEKETDRLTIVIINFAEKRLGLVVNSLEGEQEIVMKNLGRQLVKVGGIAGATVLGSGQVVLVLNAADILKLATGATARPVITAVASEKSTEVAQTILVVDDSITTRTLEKNILEAAGYRVRLATDGEEAFNLLLAETLPNLIISDVEMPRLDGFGLGQRVKQDKRFSNIPFILVTSLDSPASKARGIEIGADAYIVKSSFDQVDLLQTIQQLIL
jgi:two-component system chemotaxis sensor kinase CheA